jgi:DNA replication protein DnaC
MGDLVFCECKAGQAYRTSLAKRANQLSDTDRQKIDVAAAKRRKQAKAFEIGNIPPKYAEFTLAGYFKLVSGDKDKKPVLHLLRQYANDSKVKTEDGERNGVFLWGNSDQGKTGALSPVFLKMVKELNMTGLWLQYNTMMANLKDFSDEGRDDVSKRLRACKEVEILFIDDLGDPLNTKGVSDYDRDTMFQILDYRNTNMLPTLITSNLAPEQLALMFHERVMKRIREMCAIVEVKGKSMATLKKEAKV